MTEKRYRGNKYVDCYCVKHDQILVGTEMYKYLNPFATVVGVILTIWALLSGINIFYKLMFVLLFGLPAIGLPIYNYKDAIGVMLKAGHTKECSQKVARMVMFRASLWSEFKIMKSKDDGKRLWW